MAAGSCGIGLAAVGCSAATNADPASGTTDANSAFGTLVDYSAGVPSAAAILAAGHVGAVRYVSDPLPGEKWMVGKPMSATEAESLVQSGLEVVSCYQYQIAEPADWRGGFAAGVRNAERGLELHLAAGGPKDRPIYACIDSNPKPEEFATVIASYLLGWQSVLGKANTGVYGNSATIDQARAAGLGSFYWQHNWGTPTGYVHPAAHLHQYEIDSQHIDGVGVDVNRILQRDYGQWSLA